MVRIRIKSVLIALALILTMGQSLNAEEIIKIFITGPGANAEYIREGETEQNPVAVQVGQTVRWINQERPRHTATMMDDSGNRIFNTGTLTEDEKADVLMDQEVFMAAGGTAGGTVEMEYLCAFHPQTMKGKIVLTDTSPTPAHVASRGDLVISKQVESAKVYSVDDLEVQILESFPPKALLTARGTVPSTGWTNPRLIPYVYIVPPADGIYEFDFLADRPNGISLPVLSPITAKYIYPNLTGVRGFRVHASSNSKEIEFEVTKTTNRLSFAERANRLDSAPAPDLPPALKSMLADEAVRMHHRLWHFVRNPDAWNSLPPASRQQLIQMGWHAPRFENEPGAGLDFLYMHRQMIEMTNARLATLNDPYWDRVSGWDPIPWTHDDPEWPVPDWPNPLQGAAWARQPETVLQMQELAQQFRDPDWLRTVSLDQLGSDMEFSIHAWMHLRWSAPPPSDPDSPGPSNDWLYRPYSSHVNKHFWKLHGWIDDRISDWEAANNTTADFSNSWVGPPGVLPDRGHRADLRAKSLIPAGNIRPIPMLPKASTIERLKKSAQVNFGS